ncbi:leucyl aminopeptidase [Clostridium celatum]|uniref:leucyl aminopeptidase n=1 Tax=Clostridium celatum TaxID=36834 RepID=UPI001896EDEE|nr:leucyl aminopeptidase [Clostridium celatum]MDU6296173.1 leucyl aminopeptidase [Clostridium celatum]MDY3360594.1 leucyl aminopeptidase [Clostridium celatum]
MIQVKDISIDNFQGIINLVYEDQEINNKVLENLKLKKVFEGKSGQVFYKTTEDLNYEIFVGLGKFNELEKTDLINAVAKGVKQAEKLNINELGINFIKANGLCTGGITKSIVQGVKLASYKFDKYKGNKEAYNPNVTIVGAPKEKLEKMKLKIEEASNVADGIIVARDLVNEPANVLYPETLAKRAVEIGKESGFEVEVFDEKQIEDLGMKAFLEVGKGSVHKPRLIVMRYMGNENSDERVGLVGKGLTFDTGGYSLKPSASMDTMKSDMGGAAAVIGTMQALAKNKVSKNVVAVVAACENAISGGSYKPGDIIGSMSGKTIEVLNTDAEGRLTLVDAITYIIEKENVDKVVDVATLTGAVLVALGTEITGVLSNNDEFYEELVVAARRSGEKFWRLPNDKCFKKLYKGDFAELKNTGGRFAGTITAGMFIEEFVQDKPWLHLDIAGTSWTDAANDSTPKGGTGAPVSTLYELVVKHQCKHK